MPPLTYSQHEDDPLDIQFDPFGRENPRPVLAQAHLQFHVQTHEPHPREIYHQGKQEPAILSREEYLRRYHEYKERKQQQRLLKQEHEQFRQSQVKVKQEKLNGEQVVHNIVIKARVRQYHPVYFRNLSDLLTTTQDLFPGRPEKAKQFLAMMNSCTPTRDLRPEVEGLFRTAPEVVQYFDESMSEINRWRFPQPQLQQPLSNLPPFNTRRPELPGGGHSDNYVVHSAVRSKNTLPQPQGSNQPRRQDLQKLLKLPEINFSPDQRKGTPFAMSCRLLEHQKVGLTWLIKQEEDRAKLGGILADTMGLGKTIQALALILARPSRSGPKTTLIVAPPALLQQWEREIQKKVKPQYKLSTFIFHGPKAKRGMTAAKLLTYDVVLTTYDTITYEYGYRNSKPRIILGHDTVFYRVILDEAHKIKNRAGVGSTAVARIKSRYRLCMTGTPFMNSAEEIYPLVRFLRIRPYDAWDAYNRDIHKPIKSGREDAYVAAMGQLQKLLRNITLRRTKTSMLDGKPIIELPELVIKIVSTEFDTEQGHFYTALEQRQQLKVNEFTKTGTLMRRYTYILVLLLRLRQACCHPHLIKDFGIPEGAKLSAEEMRQLALKLEDGVVKRIKGQTTFECPFCNEVTNEPLIISPCGHTVCTGCFSAIVESAESHADSYIPCPQQSCDSEIDPERVICHCFFMEAHKSEDCESDDSDDDDSDVDSDGFESLPDDSEEVDARGKPKGFITFDDEKEGFDSDDSLSPCEEICRRAAEKKSIDKGKPAGSNKLKTGRDLMSDEDYSPEKGVSDSKGKRKRPSGKNTQGAGKKKTKKNNGASKKSRKGKTQSMSLAELKKASSTNAAAKEKYLKKLRKEYVPSAKITKTMEILGDIRRHEPQEKTLVFSLWTSFLDLLEIPMQDQGFKYARYDGSMRQTDRDAVVQKFMDTADVKVMLVSLSAGNAGLNLTAATHIIILEPFWNPFIEEQAIDRAHRIGQKKKVTVYRVLIAGTVEDRICQLQEAKRQLVHHALGEGGAKAAGGLTNTQLMGLLGVKQSDPPALVTGEL
ncbi:hypothetical protein F4776DRAFT_198360 [Hypoxylon sp. NC0597]|nr:hypothetical protein F4776DRAFT_198360 [Hypoxylon sp. NC0597]